MKSPQENLNTQTDTIKGYLIEGRYADAQLIAKNALVEHRLSAQLWLFLAESLESQGNRGQAWFAYERAWLLDPPATWASAAFERLKSSIGVEEPETWLAELLNVPHVSVAAAIIARNEQDVIEQTILNLKPAVDQIIVVDTGSSDNTAEIARRCGAEVHDFEWCDDFSEARNFALSKVNCDWVIFVDADERLEPLDAQSIRTCAGLFDQSDSPIILRVVVLNEIASRIDPNYDVSRLFPTRYGLRWWGRIHEQIGPPENGLMSQAYSRPCVRIRFRHQGYQPDIVQKKNKLERNVNLLKRAVEDDPNDVASWGFLGREQHLLGQNTDAVESLYQAEKLAKSTPNYARLPEVRTNLIDALMALDRLDEALNVAERATRAHSNFPAAWYGEGKTKMAKAVKLLQEALHAFKTSKERAPLYRGVVTYDPQIPRWKADVAIADALKLLGDWENAQSFYFQALQSVPEHPLITEQLNRMMHQATLLTRVNQLRTSDPVGV